MHRSPCEKRGAHYYLKQRMLQSNRLAPDQRLDRSYLIQLLKAKINEIDWENAKADIYPFITEPACLQIWSSQFFLDLIEHLITE